MFYLLENHLYSNNYLSYLILILWGAFAPLFFCQNSMHNSPFVEGVGFFISGSLWKKTKVVLGDNCRCFFESHISECWLPTLPRRPSVATPSAEGEFRSRSATDTASKNLAMLFHKNWRFRWQIAVAVGGCLVYKMG